MQLGKVRELLPRRLIDAIRCIRWSASALEKALRLGSEVSKIIACVTMRLS
jgi:hypothetical protein